MQRSLAALETSRAALTSVSDTAANLSSSLQQSAPVQSVLEARDRATTAVSDATVAVQVRAACRCCVALLEGPARQPLGLRAPLSVAVVQGACPACDGCHGCDRHPQDR